MRNTIYLLAAFFLFQSCSNREAAIPAYITVTDFKIETDYSDEGTASSNITTVWVLANGEEIGVFELPVRFPLIANGQTEIKIIPGINLNGTDAYRNQYEFYNAFKRTYTINAGQEITIASQGKATPVTQYSSLAEIIKLEDFEGAGINFQQTAKSDSSLYITTDPDELFFENGLNEPNSKSGKVVLPKGNSVVEFESIQTYNLPQFGANVYLEVNYKCDVPITFGVFANNPGERVQAPVVVVKPTSEWKKIYINLVTEVSAYPNANSFQLFFGATNTDNTTRPQFFVDNLKLVYWP